MVYLSYGRGKPERNWHFSWPAAISFTLALILIAFSSVAYSAFKAPSTGEGWAHGVWWICTRVSLWFLYMASWALGPIAIGFGFGALWKVRHDSGRYITKITALFSMIVAAIVPVGSSMALHRARVQDEALTPHLSPAVIALQNEINKELSDAQGLEELSDTFALIHDGKFPTETRTLSDWMIAQGRSDVADVLKNFNYYGQNVNRIARPTTAEAAEQKKTILFIGRAKFAGGTRIVLFCGDRQPMTWPDDVIRQKTVEYNKTRIRLGLPEIEWGGESIPGSSPAT